MSASQLYPNIRQLFATAGFNWTANTVKAMLMAYGYVPDFTNVHLSDLQAEAAGSIIATSGNITTRTATNGYCNGDTINFGILNTSLLSGPVVFFQDTGTASTSPLILYLDTADIPGSPQVLNGLEYYLYQNAGYGGWFRL